ncbi:CpaD family pilus assembly lipoprotein [Paraburkholderia sediminicola]|uniref:CpaD family pilus assembly lipoprotein n=1 Tax=Paraburkholderia sediminicola TaxID=458836 RepID=UPI0038B9DDDD
MSLIRSLGYRRASWPSFASLSSLSSLASIAWRSRRRTGWFVCLLLGGCLSTPPPIGMPDVAVIGLRDGHAAAPDCAALATPSDFRDAGAARPANAFGCATFTNLAAVLARPTDLAAPQPFAGADAAVAASAVRRYETGKITPLQSNDTSNFNK